MLRPNTILLILALCAGMLAPGLAGGQRETPLDVCLDSKRELAARADACRTAAGAPKIRDAMTKLMTPEQIAEAQRMASEWFEKRKGK